jgi:hypothetical protein
MTRRWSLHLLGFLPLTVPLAQAGEGFQAFTFYRHLARPSCAGLDVEQCRQLYYNYAYAWLTVIAIVLVLAVWTLAWIILRHLGSGRRRLAQLYPAAPAPLTGQRTFAWRVVIGRRYYQNMTWLRIDDSYLHVSGPRPFRRWLPTFSAPLSDITVTPDKYRWALFDPDVIRLTFGRDPSVRCLVWPSEFQKLTEASKGRLRPVEAAGRWAAGR